jgi:hypothetical protein
MQWIAHHRAFVKARTTAQIGNAGGNRQDGRWAAFTPLAYLGLTIACSNAYCVVTDAIDC